MKSLHNQRTGGAMLVPPALSTQKKILFLLLAMAYGFVLSQLPDSTFRDFTNYLAYAENSWEILIGYSLQGPLSISANEPIWFLANAVLGTYFEPETVVRIIIFSSASSVAWLVLRHYPEHFFWLMLFLFLPQVIKNHLIHLRQGAAIALFLWGWFSVNRSVRWLLLGLTPFVHASFYFVLALLWLTWMLRQIRFAADLRTIAYIAVAITVGFSVGWLAQAMGARQGTHYAFEMADVSGLGFVLWLMVAGILLTGGRNYLRKHSFESGVVIFYLATYWLIEVTARIFESGLIMVLIAGLALRGWRKRAFLAIIIGSGGLAWLARVGQPALGFAVG